VSRNLRQSCVPFTEVGAEHMIRATGHGTVFALTP
jgi:hypothetical protein